MTPAEISAIAVSLQVSLVAVICSLPLGIAAGWLLARKRFPGKLLLETCVNLPLVMPPVVTGYLLLVAFGREGVIGSWLQEWFGVQLVFDWKGAALAAAVVSFPLLVRSIRSAIAGVDVRLEDAARTLGAAPWDLFFSVTLPLARRGVIAGAVLAFARALGEFGATIMIAGNIAGETRTIPLMIYSELETPGGERNIIALIVASIAISAAALFVSEYLERRVEPAAH
ncbi:molybdate ABC transporter permease subunit [Blastopirellula sp. JC732]|uniref:Molybdenum transport system permease n=1 Tax=Blastopirellula sediminis TaxID=2894196 RepID=A0A9X1SEL1_9BACT|nr:molybdate ABC transporter permease subunit [Blastopirellula sediminis]MCC9607879.1 molybdate ABC transporter permease subunit [Blastopirellula sediminis]MCC9627328.1 molybdate ABC transporter permease subunit [Blastopirellula sediminis]